MSQIKKGKGKLKKEIQGFSLESLFLLSPETTHWGSQQHVLSWDCPGEKVPLALLHQCGCAEQPPQG